MSRPGPGLRRYTLRREPRDAVYAALLGVARQWCGTALVVVRDQLDLRDSGREVLTKLREAGRLRTRRSSTWPGTELIGSLADVHEAPYDDAVVEVLVSAPAGLYDWQQPDLPEDLCLLRPDGRPWLVTIAHERDAYIDLADDEVAALRRDAPDVAALLRDDDEVFDVDAYYRFVGERFPELVPLGKAVRAHDDDALYPFLWNVLSPLVLNVGMHGAQSWRREVFACVEELMSRFPELDNEIGVGVVEMAPDGWYEVVRDAVGPRLRARLDVWEPGWTERRGPRRRAADPYGVEQALKLAPPAPRP